MLKIKEVIVVEGRDDVINLKRFIDAEYIITHGYGIKEETFKRIEFASKRTGVIVLTDPDFAGEAIRKRISKRVPDAKHAFIPRDLATRKGDIGVENAGKDAIIDALKKVHTLSESSNLFTQSDMIIAELIGSSTSHKRRDEMGKRLGIGYANAKQFLGRLNGYGITREEFLIALEEMDKNE